MVLLDEDRAGDDKITTWSDTVKFEPITLSGDASRTSTTIGSPVYLSASHVEQCKRFLDYCLPVRHLNPFDNDRQPFTWKVIDAPNNSTATIQQHASITTFRPDVPGTYNITPSPGAQTSGEGTIVTITATNDSNTTLLHQYAPIVHFHENTNYYPTRFEAYFANAKPRCNVCFLSPDSITILDLKNISISRTRAERCPRVVSHLSNALSPDHLRKYRQKRRVSK